MKKIIRDSLKTAGILSLSFLISLLFQDVFRTQAYIPTVFVFAVFLISLLTDGYVYGIVSAFASVLAVNYAFTFPYFQIDFIIPENFFAAVIMICIALLTSALTTKIKYQELIRAQAEKERMRANLLRAISHDLRTPLTTIYGSSSALIEECNSFTEEQKLHLLWGIREDAQWLVRMVENLLSITRIDSGATKIMKTPTVLEELVDSVLVKFRKSCPAQEVRLELPENIVVIPMDAMLIEQVLVNILENAVLHAKGMTELSLRVKTDGGKACFEVMDNGCGIPKERIENLFTGYNGVSGVLADGQKRNAGIGLSVCATIIKAHGGEIQAQSSASGGALFRFWLALEEEYE